MQASVYNGYFFIHADAYSVLTNWWQVVTPSLLSGSWKGRFHVCLFVCFFLFGFRMEWEAFSFVEPLCERV